MKRTHILECTLRDGSYVVDFQFSEQFARDVAAALDRLGFEYIEVGHGMGLGASEKMQYVAAETDEVYMRAAAETVKRGKWGMFCIPGIAELSHVDLAGRHGMQFIRIGTNVNEYARARDFIERAKKYGMFVCANFMKSYVCTPQEFAHYAHEAAKFGADLVYIVDSAGGMFPEDIVRYVEAVREKAPQLKLGFHGHNNLGMGVINAVRAAQSGVDVVDTSLQGFGRSAGNTPTEQFICAMMRSGVDLGFDPIAVMEAGEQHIQPLITSRGLDSVDTIAGLAQFHSSYMPVIEEFAKKFRVDPRRLIIAVCEKNRTDAPRALVEAEAQHLAEAGTRGNWKALYKHYYGSEQSPA